MSSQASAYKNNLMNWLNENNRWSTFDIKAGIIYLRFPDGSILDFTEPLVKDVK